MKNLFVLLLLSSFFVHAQKNVEIDHFFQMGKMSEINANYPEALKNYHKILLIDELNTKAYQKISHIHSLIQNYDSAFYYIDFALAIETNEYFYQTKANYHQDLGEHQLAIHYYNKALKINPNLTNVYLQRGFCYLTNNQIDNALKDFAIAWQINSEEAKAYTNMNIQMGLLPNANQMCKFCENQPLHIVKAIENLFCSI